MKHHDLKILPIVDSAYFKNENDAVDYCEKYNNKYLGPAKGIPDQEVESE